MQAAPRIIRAGSRLGVRHARPMMLARFVSTVQQQQLQHPKSRFQNGP